MQVVTDVLPRLKDQSRSLGEIKSSLIIMLDAKVVDSLWGPLVKVLPKDLKYVQETIDSDEKLRGVLSKLIKNIVEEKNISISISKIERSLFLSLRRPPARRKTVYETFLNMILEREMRKAVTQRSVVVNVSTLRNEAIAYAHRLAVYMTVHGMTKLAEVQRSKIFSDKSPVDVFFSDEPLIAAARRAAPVRFTGGFLTFNHKTVQEYNMAEAIMKGVDDCMKAIALITPNEMLKLLESILSDNNDNQLSPPQMRRNRELIFDLAAEMQKSPLATVSLTDESAVIDFLVDYLVDDSEILIQFKVVHLFAFRYSDIMKYINGDVPDEGQFFSMNQTCQLFLENLEAIVKTQLPRRKQRTILHEAASAGSIKLIQLVLEIQRSLSKENFDEYLKGVDLDMKTSFFCAADEGQVDVCEYFLNKYPDVNFLKCLARDVNSLVILNRYEKDGPQAIVTGNSLSFPKWDKKDIYGVSAGFPSIALTSRGCEEGSSKFMYEVKVGKDFPDETCVSVGWSHVGWSRSRKKLIKKCGDELGTAALQITKKSDSLYTMKVVCDGNELEIPSSVKDSMNVKSVNLIGIGIDLYLQKIYFSLDGTEIVFPDDQCNWCEYLFKYRSTADTVYSFFDIFP